MIHSAQFGEFILILFAATIAPDRETPIQTERKTWRRSEGICLAKRDSMSPKDVFSNMTPTIFAEHHPVITDIFPHKQPPKAGKLVGWVPVEWSDYHSKTQSYLRFFGQATDMAAR